MKIPLNAFETLLLHACINWIEMKIKCSIDTCSYMHAFEIQITVTEMANVNLRD